MNWDRQLAQAIEQAEGVEAAGSALTGMPKIGLVAFCTLVRQRRVASAIRALGPDWGYEARILVRTMLELHFNLAWLGMRQPNQRANRFVRFRAIEVLAMLQDGAPSLGVPPELGPVLS